MWGRRRRLEDLYEELKTIAMLNRLGDSGTHFAGDDEAASAVRQRREVELLATISKLNGRKLHWSRHN